MIKIHAVFIRSVLYIIIQSYIQCIHFINFVSGATIGLSVGVAAVTIALVAVTISIIVMLYRRAPSRPTNLPSHTLRFAVKDSPMGLANALNVLAVSKN